MLLSEILEANDIPDSLFDKIKNILTSHAKLEVLIATIEPYLDEFQAETVAYFINDRYGRMKKKFFGEEEKGTISLDSTAFSSLTLDGTALGDTEEYYQDEALESVSPEKLLQSLFPSLSFDEILNVLQENGFDIEAAISQITAAPMVSTDNGQSVAGDSNGLSSQFSAFSDSSQFPASVPGQNKRTGSFSSVAVDQRYPQQPITLIQPKKIICRHFLSGGCYRKDCWFSHDLEQTVCKYWIQGHCLKGDACEFAHGSQLMNRVTQSSVSGSSTAAPPAETVEQEDEEAFPALGSSSLPTQKVNLMTPVGFAAIAKKKTSTQQPVRPKPIAPPLAATTSLNTKKKKIKDVEWLSTGSQVSSLYSSFRKEAEELARERNRLFQLAANAYLSGNKASAKNLSIKAHYLNKRMQELHSNAAKQIYTSRNAEISAGTEVGRSIKQISRESTENSAVIDLHGLHPTEAVDILSSELENLYKQGKRSVLVVTGTGNHSRNAKQKLYPAVKQFLMETRGLGVSEATMRDNRGGMFHVEIKDGFV